MMRTALALALLLGCGMGGSSPGFGEGFEYTATFDVDPYETPSIQSVSFDGDPVSMPYSLTRILPEFWAGIDLGTVGIVTASGNHSFELIPSACGGEVCGKTGEPPCAELTSEIENWAFDEQSLASKTYFSFGPDDGICVIGGQDTGYAY